MTSTEGKRFAISGGRRILICGLTGAGKTTLGRILANSLALPFVDLDAILWLPGHRQRTDEDFRAQIRKTLNQHPEGWIVAGNNIRQSDGMVFRAADTIICLRPPFRETFWRLLRRTLFRIATREPLGGNADTVSFRREFLSRDSLLLYALRNRKAHGQTVDALLTTLENKPQVIVVRKNREVDELISSLPVRSH